MATRDRFKYFLAKQGATLWKRLHSDPNPDPLQKLITASVVQTIVGFPYSGANLKKTWLVLTNKIKGDSEAIEHEPCLVWGKDNEIVALSELLAMHPHILAVQPGLIVHPEVPWLGASPDGFLLDTITDDLLLLEIKCPFYPHPDVATPPKTKWDLSARVIIQTTVQMMCSQPLNYCLLYYWCRQGTSLFGLRYDRKLAQKIMQALNEFRKTLHDSKPPCRYPFKRDLQLMIQRYKSNRITELGVTTRVPSEIYSNQPERAAPEDEATTNNNNDGQSEPGRSGNGSGGQGGTGEPDQRDGGGGRKRPRDPEDAQAKEEEPKEEGNPAKEEDATKEGEEDPEEEDPAGEGGVWSFFRRFFAQ